MTNGSLPAPDPSVSTAAITIADSGRRSTAAIAAAMPTAIAGVIENPGSWPAISPATAPRNSPGKVGPPRKLPSESE